MSDLVTANSQHTDTPRPYYVPVYLSAPKNFNYYSGRSADFLRPPQPGSPGYAAEDGEARH